VTSQTQAVQSTAVMFNPKPCEEMFWYAQYVLLPMCGETHAVASSNHACTDGGNRINPTRHLPKEATKSRKWNHLP